MIAKITVGRGLRSALNYDLLSKKGKPVRAQWVAGTLSGTPRQMSQQAALHRSLRPNVAAPVWRCSLSLPQADGRRTPEFWQKIATDFLEEMGVNTDSAAWCAVRHDDRDHDHIHISLVRGQLDGSLFDRANDVKRAIKATQLLEQRHHLNTHQRGPPMRARPTLQDQQIQKRTGTLMSKPFIQQRIDIFIATKQGAKFSFEEFQSALRSSIVDATAARTAKGKLQGISFKFENVAVPASALGSAYSTKGLIARGLQIDEFLMAEEKSTEAKTVKKEQDADDRADDRVRDMARHPAMIRGILRAQTRHKLGVDLPKTLNNLANAEITPAAKALTMVSFAAMKLGVEALEALIRFIKWLLAKLGLGLKPAEPGSEAAQGALHFEPHYIDIQSRIAPQPAPQTAIENATEQLLQVEAALLANDSDLLPPGRGRGELVAALAAERSPFSITPADTPGAKNVDIHQAQEIKQDGLDQLFNAEPEAVQPTPDQLVEEALADFKRAVETQTTAEDRANNAPKVIAKVVIDARQMLIDAEKKLRTRENDHWAEQAAVPRLLKFAFPSIKAYCAQEIKVLEAAKATLAAASSKHPARVPEDLSVALLQTRIGSVRAGKIALALQKKLLARLGGGDAELLKVAKSKIHLFEAHVTLLGHHPSTGQAQITLKCGYDAITSIAEKRIEIEAAARQALRNALEASSQKHLPRYAALEDEVPGR